MVGFIPSPHPSYPKTYLFFFFDILEFDMWIGFIILSFHQRFWRNYLNQKQIRDEAVQQDALVIASAATLLQASWRAHLERQRFLEIRTAVIAIQRRWREHSRRRHSAATYIQARWKGHRESKKYHLLRNRIILLQSACRGFRARQR